MPSCRLRSARLSGPARSGRWAFLPLVAAMVLSGGCGAAWAQEAGGNGQPRGAPPSRTIPPETRDFAPLRPEPGDIWSEVKSWNTGPRRPSKAEQPAASAEGAHPARRPTSGRRDAARKGGVSAGGR